MSKTTMVNAILLILSIGLAVCGQLSMKAGMNKVGEITASDFSQPFELVGRVAKSAWAVTGIILYAVSAIFWLIVLSRIDLSVAYPLVAAGYVFVVFYSWLVFKESVRWFSWIGLGMIVIGVIITAQGLKSADNGDKDSLKPAAVQVAGEIAPSPENDASAEG